MKPIHFVVAALALTVGALALYVACRRYVAEEQRLEEEQAQEEPTMVDDTNRLVPVTATHLKFDKNSYARAMQDVTSGIVFALEFELMTLDAGFVMLYGKAHMAGQAETPFIAVRVEHDSGLVVLYISPPLGGFVMKSQKRIDDGFAHRIRIARRSTGIWTLAVDDARVESGPMPVNRQIGPGPLIVGGLHTREAANADTGIVGIKACIKNITLDGRLLNRFATFRDVKLVC